MSVGFHTCNKNSKIKTVFFSASNCTTNLKVVLFNPMTHHLLDWELVKKKTLLCSKCSCPGNSLKKKKEKEIFNYMTALMLHCSDWEQGLKLSTMSSPNIWRTSFSQTPSIWKKAHINLGSQNYIKYFKKKT